MSMEISSNVSVEEGDEQIPLSDSSASSAPDILEIVRNSTKNDDNCHVVRPAQLVSSLGLSIEDSTRELCGLLSAVGGGENGASFVFESVQHPTSSAAASAATTTMVFTFPPDFEKRALRHRSKADFKQRLHTISIGVVKVIKIFTAFGLIISLAVLIIAGICLLVAAVVAMARGGGGGGGGHRNHPFMHRLRFLFFELRQILWLYAICGNMGGNQDPFLREVAGDLAMAMSICCGNPMNIFFWMRLSGMSRRWGRGGAVARRWGGSSYSHDLDAVAMMRRGTWGDENDNQQSTSLSQSSDDEQRGLLSIAVEFLFGPSDSSTVSRRDLEKWKFRASIIIALSSANSSTGVSLRELLPYVDNPPKSVEDASAMSEALKIVTYFNGRPLDCDNGSDNSNCMEARFCFPELMAEMDHDMNSTSQKLFSLGNSEFAPSSSDTNISSILYKEDEDTSMSTASSASDGIPLYLFERPFVLTDLSRDKFGQCAILGLLNFFGVIWIQKALSPGGLLQLPVAATAAAATASTGSRRRKRQGNADNLIAAASFLILGLFEILRFYAGLFFAIPLCRLGIILLRNYGVQKRNERRQHFSEQNN